MAASEPDSNSTSAMHNWLITLAIVFLGFFGVILSLVCIYAMPDHTVQPVVGSVFYMCSTFVVVIFLFLRWRKEAAINKSALLNFDTDSNNVRVKETLSDKIIKWVTLLYVFSFVFFGFAIALICIYALPDKSVQPKTGLFYFVSSAMVIATFVCVVWKNWTCEDKKP